MTTIKTSYGTATAFTWTTLNSLASDTNLLNGAWSANVSNTSTLAVDYMLGGVVVLNGSSTPTAGTIEIWVYSSFDNGTTYTASSPGTDVTTSPPATTAVKNTMKLAFSTGTDATTNRAYNWNVGSLAALFGGIVPDHFGLFCTHSTVQTLKTTTNSATYTAITYTNT